MFFYVVIKNLNWEVLTNNVVTFKRRMELEMKNLNITGIH